MITLRGVGVADAVAPNAQMIKDATAYNNAQLGGGRWTLMESSRAANVALGSSPGFARLVYAYQGLRADKCVPVRAGSQFADACGRGQGCCANIDGKLGPITLANMMEDAGSTHDAASAENLTAWQGWVERGGVPKVPFNDSQIRGALVNGLGLRIPRADETPGKKDKLIPIPPDEPTIPEETKKASNLPLLLGGLFLFWLAFRKRGQT